MVIDVIPSRPFSDKAAAVAAPARFRAETRTVHTATPAEVEPAVEVLVRAFRTDPSLRWCYPDDLQYHTHFPHFVRAFAGKAYEHGTAYCAEGYAGAALWLPPGVHPDDDALTAVLERSVRPEDKPTVFAVFEQMETYHPGEPHWYLPLIGVDPVHQRKGYGSALLEPVLTICDRERMPAYLESSNPANVPFYEAHGFAVLGTVRVEGSPPVLPMVRKPRRRA